jgi:hypothetical protein
MSNRHARIASGSPITTLRNYPFGRPANPRRTWVRDEEGGWSMRANAGAGTLTITAASLPPGERVVHGMCPP